MGERESLMPTPEELRPVEFGFDPDDEEAIKLRKITSDSIDKHIAEIFQKLREVKIEKLGIEQKNKMNLRYIRENVLAMASLKANIELTLADLRYIEDKLGNFNMSLGFLKKSSLPDVFLEKAREIKRMIEKKLTKGIDSSKGHAIH